MVRSDLKVHPKMLTSILQGKGSGEAGGHPYWKLEEVSFLQAGIFHPTAVVVLEKGT